MRGDEIIKLLENVTKPVSAIEKQIGIPPTGLQKAMKDKRPLPKRWSILLKDYVARKLYLGGVVKIQTTKQETTQNSTKSKKPDNPISEKETPKNEENRPLSYREQLYNKKMGIK